MSDTSTIIGCMLLLLLTYLKTSHLLGSMDVDWTVVNVLWIVNSRLGLRSILQINAANCSSKQNQNLLWLCSAKACPLSNCFTSSSLTPLLVPLGLGCVGLQACLHCQVQCVSDGWYETEAIGLDYCALQMCNILKYLYVYRPKSTVEDWQTPIQGMGCCGHPILPLCRKQWATLPEIFPCLRLLSELSLTIRNHNTNA